MPLFQTLHEFHETRVFLCLNEMKSLRCRYNIIWRTHCHTFSVAGLWAAIAEETNSALREGQIPCLLGMPGQQARDIILRNHVHVIQQHESYRHDFETAERWRLDLLSLYR